MDGFQEGFWFVSQNERREMTGDADMKIVQWLGVLDSKLWDSDV